MQGTVCPGTELHGREKATERRRKAAATPAGRESGRRAAALQPREETGQQKARPGGKNQRARPPSRWPLAAGRCATAAGGDGAAEGQARRQKSLRFSSWSQPSSRGTKWEAKRSRATARRHSTHHLTAPPRSPTLPSSPSARPPAFPLLGAGRRRLRPDPRRVLTGSSI
ncbi:hypothetical protein PVAP13_6KG342200 [Panicum virgatum]|uniref:Uncharacterized protein n=1 Tax=Panicum virgatum TaxID=38727 RepID=A0A8T0RFS2_PANVG|nr:hypothetical protein PVAP13_6KG342200 [Panicum virgatum]